MSQANDEEAPFDGVVGTVAETASTATPSVSRFVDFERRRKIYLTLAAIWDAYEGASSVAKLADVYEKSDISTAAKALRKLERALSEEDGAEAEAVFGRHYIEAEERMLLRALAEGPPGNARLVLDAASRLYGAL